MDGRKYNRAVRFHKLVYEALLRLVWSGFLSWMRQNHNEDLTDLEEATETIDTHTNDVSQQALLGILQSATNNRIMCMFDNYVTTLRSESSRLTQYWMSYIDLVEILLGLLRATREGDWLYIKCPSASSSHGALPMTGSNNKSSLIKFLIEEWKQPIYREKLRNKTLYATCTMPATCSLKTNGWILRSYNAHKKTLTRASYSMHSTLLSLVLKQLSSEQTLMVISLAFAKRIPCKVYQKCGTKNRTRFIDNDKLADALGEEVCKALVGLHAFTDMCKLKDCSNRKDEETEEDLDIELFSSDVDDTSSDTDNE
uniref:Uncharacterized protein n=1 Tax=Branchiostoma floridae TaxID=7739 RepID=C3XUS2_BRAFL|eukprot:XP_002612138.1 hypothetical protein BRAFLDRAFT_88877 [Branchiostoma floridae]